MYYKSWQKFIKLLKDYSKNGSEAKYKANYGEWLKILTPKQMLQKLPITLVQVNTGNTGNNIMNSIKL